MSRSPQISLAMSRSNFYCVWFDPIGDRTCSTVSVASALSSRGHWSVTNRCRACYWNSIKISSTSIPGKTKKYKNRDLIHSKLYKQKKTVWTMKPLCECSTGGFVAVCSKTKKFHSCLKANHNQGIRKRLGRARKSDSSYSRLKSGRCRS